MVFWSVIRPCIVLYVSVVIFFLNINSQVILLDYVLGSTFIVKKYQFAPPSPITMTKSFNHQCST